MFEIKLTLSADERTLTAIENLTAAFSGKTANPLSAVPAGKGSRSKTPPAAENATPDAGTTAATNTGDGASEEQKPAAEASAKKVWTLEEIRAEVKRRRDESDAGKNDFPATALKALLTEFGAAKVPEVKPEAFEMFMQKIQAA